MALTAHRAGARDRDAEAPGQAAVPAAPASPVPRRVRTPRWLDLRLVVGVVLVLASVLLGATLLSGARHTDPAVAVTHDLAAGTRLTAADLTTVDVQLPGGQRSAYPRAAGSLLGQVLTRPLTAGELVASAAVSQAQTGTTVNLPLGAGAAPDLHAGQRVRLWLSTASCRAVVLIGDATLQQVRDSSGSFTATGGQDIVLRLPDELAARVEQALALPDAQIRAGVLAGADEPDGNGVLPALDACVKPGTS